MTAHEDERFGGFPADRSRNLEDLVVFERVHARDPDDRRPRATKRAAKRPCESQVEDLRVDPGRSQGGGDVLETERLHAKERAQAESLVSRLGPDEKYVHAFDPGVAGA